LVAALAGCSRSTQPSVRGDAAQPTAASREGKAAAPQAPSAARPSAVEANAGLPLERIRLPKGFRIAAYATGVKNARSLALSPSSTLFVGTRENDKVFAIPNADHDATGDRVLVLAEGLDTPNGVAFHAGALYVAERSRVLRFDDIEAHLEHPPKPVVVNDSLPHDSEHSWKFIAVGPDQRLYVPIGAPCNICDKADPRYASISRMQLDGSGFEVFARGVRNTVGFAWHPDTHELWFTENGRDRMGDDLPPDELNHAPKSGLHFGYPYCHGKDLSDPEFGAKQSCAQSVPPVAQLGPHVAALGMRFYTGNMFPAEYQKQVFIAEHGSWNRSQKIGYRVSLVKLDKERFVSYTPFAEGFLSGGEVWGRPVDVLVMPDGALLVSDDTANAVYRVSYETG
jgi:glucose/arabinose dehydrogenase